MPDQGPKKEVLTQYVRTRLIVAALEAALPMGFSSPCWNDMQGDFDTALKEMEAENVLDSAASIAAAETNTRLLVAEMAKVAKELGYSELHEDTRKKARKTLCPIWPFCKERVQ